MLEVASPLSLRKFAVSPVPTLNKPKLWNRLAPRLVPPVMSHVPPTHGAFIEPLSVVPRPLDVILVVCARPTPGSAKSPSKATAPATPGRRRLSDLAVIPSPPRSLSEISISISFKYRRLPFPPHRVRPLLKNQKPRSEGIPPLNSSGVVELAQPVCSRSRRRRESRHLNVVIPAPRVRSHRCQPSMCSFRHWCLRWCAPTFVLPWVVCLVNLHNQTVFRWPIAARRGDRRETTRSWSLDLLKLHGPVGLHVGFGVPPPP